ncbi:uncharacterized protein TNCV_1133931 [Trichonephila clavipes]|nr:uncharacterized protein TNCV_1133931 [Trichonephila clavipes]
MTEEHLSAYTALLHVLSQDNCGVLLPARATSALYWTARRLMSERTLEGTVLEAKREEFVDDALMYTKSLCEELEISFEPPRRIRRKHLFVDGSKDVQLSYEDDLRRTMFSSIDRVTVEI